MGMCKSIIYVFLVIRMSLSENVTVTTGKGVVVGMRVNPNPQTGASYDAFLGIPYGEVPARFQPPVPRQNWTSPLVAHSDGPMCPQPNHPFSEDCLFLNVFTPVNASQDRSKYPVMAYIYGGGFTVGSSSSLLFGPDFLVPQDVILVTMNYRLGATGFLTLGTPEAPGNLGILDTRLALRWVQHEISRFGGDPDRVTMFGHSAGSIVTMVHYLSPGSSDLFHQAICQSGQLVEHVFEPEEAVRRAMRLADFVGCDSSLNDTVLLKCLQNVDINLLISQQNIPIPVEYLATGVSLRFMPVLDASFSENAIFPDSLENTMKMAANLPNPKPLMTGFATGDGIVKFQEEVWKLAEANLYAFIPENKMSLPSENAKDKMVEAIKDNYFPDTIDLNKILGLVRLYTDYLFAYPTIEVARCFANFTYLYVNDYRGGWNPMPAYFSKYKQTGVFHGAELTYLFYTVNSYQDFGDCPINENSLKMRDNMVQVWTNFAKTGTPDPTQLWGPYSKGHYGLIDGDLTYPAKLVNNSVVEEEHYQFWANLEAENSSANVAGNIAIITTAMLLLLSYHYTSE